MGREYSLKLALNNIKQNRKFYLPYVLASIGIVAMFYIIWFLATNQGLQKLDGNQYISMVMGLGGVIIGLFSVIFLFYINSFLMKQRRKEIGLYNILGMEKRHIGRILFTENFITSVISIVVGLACGILFSKLVFMTVCKIMNATTPIKFGISGISIIATIVVFGLIFLLLLLRNQMRIHLAKPIELLKGSNIGEREPKTKIVLSIIGVICLAAGYGISLSIHDPLKAIVLFFVAVVLVIVGTYLLFTTVSIAILKALKRNKNYYYKPQHFTSVSGMLYRMKQNAVGMANICILSTMVLVMVSTTVCMQFGVKDAVNSMAPEDSVITASYDSSRGMLSATWMDQQKDKLKELADKSGTNISDVTNYSLLAFNTSRDGSVFTIKRGEYTSSSVQVGIVTAAEYKRLTGKDAGITGNQILASGDSVANSLTLEGNKYTVVNKVDDFITVKPGFGLSESHIFVVSQPVAERIVRELKGAYSDLSYYMMFNSSSSEEKATALASEYENTMDGRTYKYATVTSRAGYESEYNGLTGGFLFLGIFLGIVFTFAAALIIYYKQISEGYYDKDKFEIMQKVGMSNSEVKRSIRSQVLMVFYIPLIVAGCHMMGAFNMVRQMLRLFNLTNVGLFLGCTALTFVAFAAIYALVYFVTAKEYYKIVQHE